MKTREAIERVKSRFDKWALDEEDLEALRALGLVAENEDERIRKKLIRLVQDAINKIGTCYTEEEGKPLLAWLEKKKEQKSIIQDVELNDAVYDYVRDHFIACADFTPEYIKKLMENAFFAGVDYYLLKQESESCEPDTNVEKVIEDVIRVYEKTQGEWVGGYDVDTLIVNLRRAFNKKEQKPSISCGHENGIEWCDNFEENIRTLLHNKLTWHSEDGEISTTVLIDDKTLKDIVSGIWFYVKQEQTESGDSEKPNGHAGWSEEDEINRNWIIRVLDGEMRPSYPNDEKLINWLKSLRPQPDTVSIKDAKKFGNLEYERGVKDGLNHRWKPTEEQMEHLKRCFSHGKPHLPMPNQHILESLYNDLKKLM